MPGIGKLEQFTGSPFLRVRRRGGRPEGCSRQWGGRSSVEQAAPAVHCRRLGHNPAFRAPPLGAHACARRPGSLRSAAAATARDACARSARARLYRTNACTRTCWDPLSSLGPLAWSPSACAPRAPRQRRLSPASRRQRLLLRHADPRLRRAPARLLAPRGARASALSRPAPEPGAASSTPVCAPCTTALRLKPPPPEPA
jgi:hypothetical protein